MFRTVSDLPISSGHLFVFTCHSSLIGSSWCPRFAPHAGSLVSDLSVRFPPPSDQFSYSWARLSPCGSVRSVVPFQVSFIKPLTCFPLFYNVMYRIWRFYFPMASILLLMTFQSRWLFSAPFFRPSRRLSLVKLLLSAPTNICHHKVTSSRTERSFLPMRLSPVVATHVLFPAWRVYFGFSRVLFLWVLFALLLHAVPPVGLTALGSLPYVNCVSLSLRFKHLPAQHI